ncbi:hypothetical protein SV7mr_29110 [Stieleria bergensis]|uniref:Uncharacterized protein n=1 Tax=Stieleria bergensis TaxID=2528025 RepID=A0A517SW81_9BACT|nr:hypothetical protein SV7mr_29110 [Planctomycetes bacterium SV_7m_r]
MRQHSSTDLCGGRPETAVPTVTEVVGNANRKQPQRNPPRSAIETINAPALPIVPFIIAPPPHTVRPLYVADGVWRRPKRPMQNRRVPCLHAL